MKLSDILSQYKSDTTKASDICRQTNYSLIAVCWIFSNESVDNLRSFKIVLFFVVTSLYFDFIQYFVRGFMEKEYYSEEEEKAKDENGKINEEYEAAPYPENINSTSTWLYRIKIICSFMALLFLVLQLLW